MIYIDTNQRLLIKTIECYFNNNGRIFFFNIFYCPDISRVCQSWGPDVTSVQIIYLQCVHTLIYHIYKT